MKDLRLFATGKYPLRASSLNGIITCPWKSVMRFISEGEDEGGVAGDTGSATHVAAREFHRGQKEAACLGAMRQEVVDYPHADLSDAAALFLAYSSDPRNRDARVICTETEVEFQIEASAEDPTGAPIQVIGHLDQVREVGGKLQLWDLKTSKKDPMDLLNKHTVQCAAYCIGASIKLGRTVHPGGLIVPRKYRQGAVATSPVFWHFSWSFDDIAQILEPVRHTVAAIRRGNLWHHPNEDCHWCHARSPDLCLPRLQQTLKILKAQ